MGFRVVYYSVFFCFVRKGNCASPPPQFKFQCFLTTPPKNTFRQKSILSHRREYLWEVTFVASCLLLRSVTVNVDTAIPTQHTVSCSHFLLAFC